MSFETFMKNLHEDAVKNFHSQDDFMHFMKNLDWSKPKSLITQPIIFQEKDCKKTILILKMGNYRLSSLKAYVRRHKGKIPVNIYDLIQFSKSQLMEKKWK